MVFIKLTALTVIGTLLFCTMPTTTSGQKDEPSASKGGELSVVDWKLLETVTEGSNKFALELYQALKEPGKNIVVSPISLQIVLALAYTGAKDDTAKQISSVLHLPNEMQDVLQGHKLLIEQLQHPVLKIANKMFVEKTMKVLAEFQQNTNKYFHSEVGEVNFVSNAEGARNEINNWVDEKTNHKIKDLLAEGAVDSLTRMVLTNAIHFKDNWKYKFNDAHTHDADFFVAADNKVKVKMMSIKKSFPFKYDNELKAKILQMPYENQDFSMVLILPDKIDGLAEVENKLAKSDLSHVLRGLYEQTVDVKLPKFKLEETMELKDILIKMGVKDIFDEGKANLTGISQNEHLYASKVVQKAFIEVNEEGTEAAAATAVVHAIITAGLPPPIMKFVADHPFLFLLKKGNNLTFIGRLSMF